MTSQNNKFNYHFINTSDNKKIRTCIWSKNKKNLVIFLNGRNEYIEKYNDVYKKFQERGYSVITLDWRGQGLSEKEKKYSNFGHVNDFAEYQIDLESVLNYYNVNRFLGKKIIVCHSTGCLIGLRFLQNKSFSFEKAIFLAPLWGGSLNQKIISKFCIFLKKIGIKKINFYKSISKPYILNTNLEKNCLTSDVKNFTKLQDTIRKNPQLNIGPPTLCWIASAASEIIKLKNKIKLDIPSLIFFGEKDIIISHKDIKKKLDNELKNIFIIKNSKHELLIEKKEIVDCIWKKIDNFI